MNALVQELTAMMEDRFQVETINSGVYTQDVRETVMSLHSLGLGVNSIADCIKIVCGKLLHVDIGVLPKTSTIKGFLLEADLLGRLQVANAMMTTENNTLHFDGTSDHQRHFFGFQITNQNKESMVMSMSESVRGDTNTQMDTFKNICSDYSKILARSCEDEKSLSARLMMSIKNLMSDQHIVNKKFCQQFEDLRGELITECGERWSGLSMEDRTTAVKVNHFFCLLHVLLGLADATDKALKEYERILTDGHRVKMGREKSGTGRKFKGDTSMAMECLRSLCQLLTPTGHAAAGLSEDFRVFLDSIDKSSMFTRFEHNRFNVIFENAAAACHHRSDVRDFLTKTPSSNQLVQSVVGDMEDEFLFAEIQAAGLFYVTITEPFHRLILSESHAPHILDVLPYLQTMQRTLEMMSKSPVIVLSPDFQMWTDLPSRTGIGKNLFLPSSDSQMDVMLEVLGLISSHTLVTYSRQFNSQQSLLSSHTSRSQTASVPKSNSISESMFGTLKRLRQFKPNATTHHLEGTILWTYNKTISWLDSLSEEEKKNAFDVARTKSAVFHKLFKERHLQLKEERIQHLASKKHKQEQKAVRQSISREKAVDGVLAAGGHCTSTEAVDDLLATYDNNLCSRQLTQTLKTNLSYFKQVVKPPGIGRVYYQYSHKGKTFTNNELANHLKHIIATYKQSVQTIQQPSAADSFTSKEDRQGPLSAARKRILSQYSIPGLPQKKKCRGPMPALIGRRITHRWKLSTKRGHAWYEGQVLCHTSIGTQPSYAQDDDLSNLAQYDLYDVQYDGDENIYHMRLEKDWHMGDLELLEM